MSELTIGLRELVPRLRRRIMDGWIVLFGPMNCIINLVLTLYLPGSKESKSLSRLFKVVVIPEVPLRFLALVKKTPKLRKKLRRLLRLPDEEFERLIALELYPVEKDRCEIQIVGARKKEDFEPAVNSFVETLYRIIESEFSTGTLTG